MNTTTDAPQTIRKPWWRWLLKWSLLTLLILVLAFVALLGWLAGTRSGLDFAWSHVTPHLPDSVQVADVEGRLIGPLTITGVAVETDTADLSIQRLHLAWAPSELLSGGVHVNTLSLSGIRYVKTGTAAEENEPEQAPTTLPNAIRLPVEVRVDTLAVDDVVVRTATDAEPLVLERARMHDAVLQADDWRVGSLTARGPQYHLAAKARLAPYGRYGLKASLQADVSQPDLAPVHTTLELVGDLDDLHVTQTVASPYNVTLDGHVRNIVLDAIDDIGIKAKLTLNETQLADIRSDLPEVGVSTTVHVDGTPQQLAVTLDARADSAAYGPATAHARLGYTPQAVTIKQLQLQRPGTPMQVTADGNVALQGDNAVDLNLGWQHLRWPLANDAAYRSDAGQFHVTGTTTDYQLDGKLAWQVTGQAEGRLQLRGSGDRQSFDIDALRIHGGPGDLTARGHVGWAPSLQAQLQIDGKHINPAAIVAGVPGDFDLHASVKARQDDDDVLHANVETLQAHGRLRHQPLQLDTQLAYDGKRVAIDHLALDYGAAQVRADGQLGWTAQAPLDLHWRIRVDDLATLWPDLAGHLQSSGRVRGTVAAPAVTARLDAGRLGYADNSIGSVHLDADADWSGDSPSRIVLNVADIEAAGQSVDTLAVKLDGTPDDHVLYVNLDSDTAQLALATDGSLDKADMTWAYTLTALKVAYGKLAPWTLAQPASGQASAQAQRIADACLTSGEARLCVDGRHDDDGTEATVDLSDLALAYFKAWIPDNMRVDGGLSGHVEAHVPAEGMPDITAAFDTTQLAITEQREGEAVPVLAFDPGRIQARLRDGGMQANVDLPLAHQDGHIKADVQVAEGRGDLMTHDLDGQVAVDLPDLGFVTRIAPQIAELDGHLGGTLHIGGTPAEPRLLGDMTLAADRIALPAPGLRLTAVELTARGHGQAIDIDMQAHSGEGQLKVNGDVRLTDDGPAVHLTARGEDFQAVNTPLVRARISPDLDISASSDAISVDGKVAVPHARITPRDLSSSGVQTVSSDTVIVTDKQSATRKAAQAIHADVTVSLGDVRINGFGLKTGIEGQIRVQQEAGEPATGSGELTLVDGSYRAYGQSLDIQKGKIYFSGGPVTEPGVELRAARYPSPDVTVGVKVRGSVNQPTVNLFSKPPMGQSDILSWLLLGRPLDNTTGAQSNLVAKAALALGKGRSNKILGDIGNALGVDDIGIGNAAGHNATDAAFMVGKYLTPRLYVSYGVGIFDSISTLSLRYTLNSHWQLKSSSSGNATGGDIIYTIDR